MNADQTVTTQLTHAPGRTGVTTTRLSLLKRFGARRLVWAHAHAPRRPQLALDAAELTQAIATALGRELETALTLEARLVETVINPWGGLARNAAYAVLDLGSLNQRAVLEVDALTTGALLSLVAGAEPEGALPVSLTRIEEAAFGWLLLVALMGARSTSLGKRLGARLLSVHTERGEVLERLDCRHRFVAIELGLGLGAGQGAARLLVPAPAAQQLVVQAPEAFDGALQPEVLAARVPARVVGGRATLSSHDLAQLSLGDVVVFDQLGLHDGACTGRVRVVASTFSLHGALAPHGFELASARRHTAVPTQEHVMSTSSDAVVPPLPVEVEVELARISLPIAELATLKPGAVLPLRISASEPVVLRIGDRGIARAELVEIDGEVGARIVGMIK